MIVLFLGYFSYFGIKTTKFNSIIKEQIKKQNKNLNIDLNKVKLLLDIKNISIKIRTKNPKIILSTSDIIGIDEISSDILISSYFQNKFAIKNLKIKSKNNEINSYINFFKTAKNNIQFILLNQFLKSGKAKFNVNLNFDENGKIKKDYSLTGKISNAELNIPKYKNINKLNFNFKVNEKSYELNEIKFEYNEIKFISNLIKIENKKEKYFIKGNLKNEKNKINKDLIFLIFKDSLENFDFSNSNFDSNSDFSFNLNKKFKIKNFILKSKLNIDELIFKNNFNKIKNYIGGYKNFVKLNKNKIQINYFEKKFTISGKSEFFIDQNFKNLMNFKIIKNKNKTLFEGLLNLENLDLKISEIGYEKMKSDKAFLKIKGFETNKKIFLENINYTESKNEIDIKNLEIKNNKIFNIHKIKFNYLTKNNFKNNITLSKYKNNYNLEGKSFDATQLIEKMSSSESENNFFEVFTNLNTKIKIFVENVMLDNQNTINTLQGNLEVKNNEIFDLKLNSNFSKNEKIFVSIKTQKNNSVITTFYSDRAEPFVKKYKFIKGFEGGNLDFTSIKINNISKSKLIIDNFKVQEVPVLAKILTLASLQGIADILTGEGVRFTDFEMVYSKKENLTTIDEIYAIGPAISILMEGYVEEKKLVSLRGTLVPATTINRSISSIPLIGDLLVGKKVGEGVFGVSFKIKGSPKNLKTTVNPIKTLTPRFITRTLEKIKKN